MTRFFFKFICIQIAYVYINLVNRLCAGDHSFSLYFGDGRFSLTEMDSRRIFGLS